MKRLVIVLIALLAVFTALRAYPQAAAGLDVAPGVVQVSDGRASLGLGFGLVSSEDGRGGPWSVLPLVLQYRSGSTTVTLSLNGLSFLLAGGVSLGRAIAIDEPTVGVDPQSRNHIFESVMRLNRERGMSSVYTSHYMEEVELLCNRAAIVDQGRIIALDTVKNLIASLGGGVIQVGLPGADEALLAQLAALPAVKRVTRAAPQVAPATDGKAVEAAPAGASPAAEIVNIEAENNQQALVNVIGVFTQHEIAITSRSILEPNLETVFLSLTGKKLRE